MAGPTGRGDSLGAALNDLLRSQVTPRHRLSSYNAKHWHAQLSQLTGIAPLAITDNEILFFLLVKNQRLKTEMEGVLERYANSYPLLTSCTCT